MTDKILEALEIWHLTVLQYANICREHIPICYPKAEECLRKIEEAIDLYKPQQSDTSWIPWGGGECPVNDYSWVEVKTRSGFMCADEAGLYIWDHRADPYDIMFYRVF